MIEVKLYLYSAEERNIFNAAMAEIDRLRCALGAEIDADVESETADTILRDVLHRAETLPTPVPDDAETQPYDPAETQPYDPAEPVAEALTRYLKQHGMAHAKALLTKFGVDRIGELPEDKHDAFREAVAAGVKE